MLRSLLILMLVLLNQAVLMPRVEAQSLMDRKHRHREEGQERKDRRGMSLDEAVQMAQRRYKARAVKAEIASDGDRRIYVIRLLNDSGRVWTVRVDAETGRMQ
ncbi:MAG TPA: PepSY domain-containing protein [Steroidobacteraceae bacterium]|nr:PepSY domain-containing protein [Steroidobacteraceae bacterium]